MDAHAAEVAFTSHMQRARAQDVADPLAALDDRRHALGLAERFGSARQVAEACGALCWSETVVFGAPRTLEYVQKGLGVGRRTGLYLARFLIFEALHLVDTGALDAAEERFTEALGLGGSSVADARLGLGNLMLRRRRFEDARQHFALVLGRDRADDLAQLRALDGQAEAERHLGEARAAAASAGRALELTASVGPGSARDLRRARSRALNGLGLSRWRAGDEADALRCFRSTLDLWSEGERAEADALIALERHQLLRRTSGAPPPVEASPGRTWAVGFLLLGRDPLTPVQLAESPPSVERMEQLGALESGDALDEPLWPVLGEHPGASWFVSRVRRWSGGQSLLLDLVPNEGR